MDILNLVLDTLFLMCLVSDMYPFINLLCRTLHATDLAINPYHRVHVNIHLTKSSCRMRCSRISLVAPAHVLKLL